MLRHCVTCLSLGAAGWFFLPGDCAAQTLTPGATITASSVISNSAAPSPDAPSALSASGGALAVASPPGAFPGLSRAEDSLPKVFAPTRPRTVYTRFPWKRRIVATVFWIGETPTANNPVPNTKSAWDVNWTENYGGYDDPNTSKRDGFVPKAFTPRQNPFYIALPYNDLISGRSGTKTSARHTVPWFDKEFERNGKTVIKGRWVAIRRGAKVCYAQWEDVGPFETDDWQYVFGDARPKTSGNGGAGIDVSPAVRDYLNFDSRAVCDWRFVDENEVPEGPWRQFGDNNPFFRKDGEPGEGDGVQRIVRLRAMRDQYLSEMPMAR